MFSQVRGLKLQVTRVQRHRFKSCIAHTEISGQTGCRFLAKIATSLLVAKVVATDFA